MILDVVLARRLSEQDESAAPEPGTPTTTSASGEAWAVPAGLEGLV